MRDNEKQELISEFWDLERDAYQKKLEYITAQVLPDCKFKTLKLEKLLREEEILIQSFSILIERMITEYGEEILYEII